MKAIVHTEFGSPDVLMLRDVDKPIPKAGEVLIKVHASSINDWDQGLMQGTPYILRLGYGLLKPRNQRLGCDVAGTVESVGAKVTQFSPGDSVYGDIHACGFGALAEYVCAHEGALQAMPTGLSFAAAAAIPHAATLAWQGLFDKGCLQSGQSVLINGAGGGVGPIALQLAKLHGAQVTGVDTGEKLEMLQALGFDHTVDYKKQDFTRMDMHYDLILDVKTTRSAYDYVRVLKPNGTYVTVGGYLPRLLQVFLLGPWVSCSQNKFLRVLALDPNRGLAEMKAHIESGKIKPIIDGPYPLDQVPEAMRLFLSGKQKGRIVITVT